MKHNAPRRKYVLSQERIDTGAYLPDEKEITSRCAKIRESWSEDQRLQRMGLKRTPWEPQTIPCGETDWGAVAEERLI